MEFTEGRLLAPLAETSFSHACAMIGRALRPGTGGRGRPFHPLPRAGAPKTPGSILHGRQNTPQQPPDPARYENWPWPRCPCQAPQLGVSCPPDDLSASHIDVERSFYRRAPELQWPCFFEPDMPAQTRRNAWHLACCQAGSRVTQSRPAEDSLGRGGPPSSSFRGSRHVAGNRANP